jgi:hypothetical protein
MRGLPVFYEEASTTEAPSSQRSENFLIKNSILCALRASVVRQAHYVLSPSKDAMQSPSPASQESLKTPNNKWQISNRDSLICDLRFEIAKRP